MARRNDIGAPYERPEARRWTRVTDYWPDADMHVANVHWTKPGTARAIPAVRERDRNRNNRGFIFPVLAVAIAALISAWVSGLFGMRDDARPANATTSRGLVFGLCSAGGLTNCVASGDSFYLGGKTVRIAGIEAPQLYGAACPREAALGRQAAAKLQQILNAGELEMTKTAQNLDGYGLLLRNVSVNGTNVGQTLVTARLAREIGDDSRRWC